MCFWWGAFFSNLLLVGSKKLLYFWWVRIVLHLHSLHLHSFHLHSFHLQSFHLHSFHSHSFYLHSFPLHSFHLHSCHSHSFYLSLSSLRGSVPSPHRFFTCTLLAVASLAFCLLRGSVLSPHCFTCILLAPSICIRFTCCPPLCGYYFLRSGDRCLPPMASSLVLFLQLPHLHSPPKVGWTPPKVHAFLTTPPKVKSFFVPPPSVGGIGSRQQEQRLRAPRRGFVFFVWTGLLKQ